MNPTDPCIPLKRLPSESRAIIIGKNQVGYIPLPAIQTPNNLVITRWSLDEDERRKILEGSDVFITFLSNGKLNPMSVQVGLGDWTK